MGKMVGKAEMEKTRILLTGSGSITDGSMVYSYRRNHEIDWPLTGSLIRASTVAFGLLGDVVTR